MSRRIGDSELGLSEKTDGFFEILCFGIINMDNNGVLQIVHITVSMHEEENHCGNTGNVYAGICGYEMCSWTNNAWNGVISEALQYKLCICPHCLCRYFGIDFQS